MYSIWKAPVLLCPRPMAPNHISPGPNSKVNSNFLSSHFGIKDVRLNMYAYTCICTQEFCKTKLLLSNPFSSFHIMHLIRNFIRQFLIKFMNIHKPSRVNQSKTATKKKKKNQISNANLTFPNLAFFWSSEQQNHITSSFTSLPFKTIIFKCLSLFLCGIILTANQMPLVSIFLPLSQQELSRDLERNFTSNSRIMAWKIWNTVDTRLTIETSDNYFNYWRKWTKNPHHFTMISYNFVEIICIIMTLSM